MIYSEIVNYLLSSLVRFSLPKMMVSSGFVAPELKSGLPVRRNMSEQRNHTVAGECMGYVLDNFIGFER